VGQTTIYVSVDAEIIASGLWSVFEVSISLKLVTVATSLIFLTPIAEMRYYVVEK
jgi:hypothetical protein